MKLLVREGLNVDKIKRRFHVGDKIMVDKSIQCIGENKIGIVVRVGDEFINVEYPEGYQESIQYIEANRVCIISKGEN
jgi:hypothetical protein